MFKNDPKHPINIAELLHETNFGLASYRKLYGSTDKDPKKAEDVRLMFLDDEFAVGRPGKNYVEKRKRGVEISGGKDEESYQPPLVIVPIPSAQLPQTPNSPQKVLEAPDSPPRSEETNFSSTTTTEISQETG